MSNKDKILNFLLIFLIGIMCGAGSVGMVLDSSSNEKGILESYEVSKFDNEYVCYLTFTISNPEIGKHRIRTVRVLGDKLPDLSLYIGSWVRIGIGVDGKYLNSINTPQGTIYNKRN